MFEPRKWQKECLEAFQEKINAGQNSFVLEACMGAGKSTEAALISKLLREDYGIDHILALVPWASIQGDVDKGMLGSFYEMGLDARPDFFTNVRRQARQPRPQMDATIATYQAICCQETLDTIRMWQSDGEGFRFALICDEIHHTNEINSSWGGYVEELVKLAAYSIFMSGTFFRTDKIPISCVPIRNGIPVKDYRYSYEQGVKDDCVRAVTMRDIDAKITIYDRQKKEKFQIPLKQINRKNLSEAKAQVLDAAGPCIHKLIQFVHEDLTMLRSSKFPDAACLFVCRPGGNAEYTQDETGKSDEDRHVHQIAEQIELITGIVPTVVTYRDKDSLGKIAWFRRTTDPYLVAVNQISEGCDIPRLRAVAFCRYTDSEMLFRQIVGRCLRKHMPEDGTSAQVYIPTFPVLLEYGERLYKEAQEGIRNRRCPKCGQYPCICPCETCGKRPCICPPVFRPPVEKTQLVIEADPIADGGHVGEEHVLEHYVRFARHVTETNVVYRHSNPVQMGHFLQQFTKMQQSPQGMEAPPPNPGLERAKLSQRITRCVKLLAIKLYDADFGAAYVHEIEKPFLASWKEIKNTWTVEQLRPVAERLERRIGETPNV